MFIHRLVGSATYLYSESWWLGSYDAILPSICNSYTEKEMREQEIQAKIIKLIKSKGGYVENIIAGSRSGIPDLVGCIKGRFFYIEVKTPTTKSKVSDLQKIKMLEAEKSGGKTLVAWSVEQVEDFIKEIKNETL